MKKILVLGAGAMGSALTVPCVDNENDVVLVGTHLENETIDQINKANNFHKVINCELPKKLRVSKFDTFSEELKKIPDLIVVGVNSKGIEWAGKEIAKNYNSKTNILLLTKGLTIISNKFETLVEKFKTVLKNRGVKDSNISAVGGPCLAAGLANRIKSSVVLANPDLNIAKSIGKMISTNYYTTEYSEDLLGVEVCAAIKNLYSMIIGASEGLCSIDANKDIKNKNYLNTAASLMYKSVSEMIYFTKILKGKEKTAYGLAGLGDLYVSSAGGRNSKMGKYLGEGYIYSEAKKKFMQNETIEGAELAFAIGSKIIEEFDKKDLPLMITLLDTIINDKKFKINWQWQVK